MRQLVRRCHPLWEQKGISLLETLLAVGILALIGVAFLSAVATGSKATGTLDEHVQAESLVRSQLEVIKDAPYDHTFPMYQGYEITAPPGYDVDFEVQHIGAPTIQEITVTVYHQGEAVLRLTDFKADR